MLERGTRFGPYEVVAPLGAGGMGEVCRARDTKLQRDVALKVLSDAFVADPGRASRFQREAQLLATLNHPHIAAIYGLEESPAALDSARAGQAGHYVRRAIVMELVDGRTLAELIERGPMPLAEALPLAKQIAEALEYAHEKGVIHRDLKPANIKVTPDGTLKVLDFGLAKALGDGSDSSIDMPNSLSPTLSLMASHAGVILGTAAYMAPEQAKGKTVDRRADVWAFGVVLYEMLAGRKMFGGDSIAETLAGVIKEPIPIGTLPADTPPAIRRLLDRCLERDVRRRLQSIGEARILIEDVMSGAPAPDTAVSSGVRSRSAVLPWGIAGAATLVAVVATGWTWTRPGPPAPPAIRFAVQAPIGTRFTANGPNAPQVAVSPDGRFVAFVADAQGMDRMLWIRPMDSANARQLDGTEGATFPFWSSDSRNLAFFANSKLMRVSVDGGTAIPVAEAPAGEGGTWFQGADGGVIVFAPDGGGPLHRVSAQGGPSSPVTTLAAGEISHSFPQFLPDGRRFLYLAEGKAPGILVQSLDAGRPTRILETNSRAMFAPPGWLLFMRESTLLAQRFDIGALTLVGEAIQVANSVRYGQGNGRNAFSVSDGVLAYREIAAGSAAQIAWYSRAGRREDVVLPPGDYQDVDLSPDESRAVVMRGATDRQFDLWVIDLGTKVFSRLTSTEARDGEPAWSPDSSRVAYVQVKDGIRAFYTTTLGSGTHSPMAVDAAGSLWLDDWTSDGRDLVAHGGEGGSINLIAVPADASPAGAVRPRRVMDSRFAIDTARVSPDRKWAAYMSTESGRAEVHVASFPSFTNRRQISSGGGVQPLWRADSRELFFLAASQDMMAVEIGGTSTLDVGPVRKLFPVSIELSQGNVYYDVTRDGQRFLVREPATPGQEVTPESLRIVVNWPSLLPR